MGERESAGEGRGGKRCYVVCMYVLWVWLGDTRLAFRGGGGDVC